MEYTISQIAAMAGVRTPSNSQRRISTLLTDSRSLSTPETTLFFAIHTSSNDGHRYIADLYERGVRAFVTDHWDPKWRHMDADFLVAPGGAVNALQQLAASHRRSFSNGTVIGITGSKGKTTLKEWMYRILSPHCKVVRSPRSYNSQTGVPLSLWLIDHENDVALIEAGISRPEEMKRLSDIISPDIALITNVIDDQSDAFGTTVEKCNEKLKLLEGAGNVVWCADHEMINEAMGRRLMPHQSVWSWSLCGREDAILKFSAEPGSVSGQTKLTIRDHTGISAIALLPFADTQSIENACHAAALMIALGYAPFLIAFELEHLRVVNTRTDVVEGVNNTLIIRDRYPADINNLGPAINFMMRRTPDKNNTTMILGRLDSSYLDAPAFAARISQSIGSRHVAQILTVADNASWLESLPASGTRVFVYDDSDQMTKALQSHNVDIAGHTVLVKGTDSWLDAVAEMLQARRHETVLEVNLDALVSNYNFYRSRLDNQRTGIVCMVKASGYGAGSYELARTLQSQGAAYLAVAVLDEGVDLRRAGISMPIMVLNPRVVNYDQLFAYKLEPEIFSFEELDAIVTNARRHGIKHYPVHIKLDTGMHRLGFIGEEIDELVNRLLSCDEVEPVSVFSHLAAADDPTMDDYTMEQFRKFDSWSGKFRSHWPEIKRHVLNSTGITRFPDHQYEMVRLGICLYGVATMDDGSQAGLRPVSSLRTSIIAIRQWPEGTTVGYNRRGVCKRPSIVATIPIGYADGINRHLGCGGMSVSVGGFLCPTIGNICMDACMIDITDCAGSVHVGDSVEIFGPNVPVETLSSALGTIPYEILTSVSTRVKRVYYRE